MNRCEECKRLCSGRYEIRIYEGRPGSWHPKTIWVCYDCKQAAERR